MPLAAPNLDDRRFQELVDEAKRMVQQRCPEWSDHNVHDPGVTMIELFAWMTDQLVYRLNRVPDRNYLKFLDLIDVKLFPPTAATCDVTFWLSAAQEEAVRIPAGTEVATDRIEGEEATVFTTVEELTIVPCALGRVATSVEEGKVRHHAAALEGEGFYAFAKTPKPDDALYVGLTEPVPACAVALDFECESEGVGVDPLNPPLVWEAWDGQDWAVCRLDRDGTGGLNRTGRVVVHLPQAHTASLLGKQRAGWLRCRVIPAEEDQPAYTASPRVLGLEAATIGGTVAAVHAEAIHGEELGVSEGVAGQRFLLRRRPVVADVDRVLQVGGDRGWEEWTEVDTFAGAGPDARVFSVEAVAGEVVLGPAVREADGSMRHYGAVPERGSILRLSHYRTGGGRRGNVARGTLRVLRTTIPYVASVENAARARGGVDGETVENARIRGPLALRTGDRAVTLEDYERLARAAAPETARVRCVPAEGSAGAGAVRLLVVPAAAPDPSGRIRFDQLVPSDDSVERISRYLDERRVVGARVVVEPPVYQGITIVARLRGRPRFGATALKNAALDALYRHFSPLEGGSDGGGWPFGRPVLLAEVYSVLQGVRGVELVEDARLFAADPTTGERGQQVDRLDVEPNALVFSYDHRVLVEGL
jgi:predicted phage baseplate assembly protein